MDTRDKFDGVGGRYEIRYGKREQVEAPTKDHPDGNLGPRGADGRLLDAPAPKAEPAAPVAPGAAAAPVASPSDPQSAPAAESVGDGTDTATRKRKGA